MFTNLYILKRSGFTKTLSKLIQISCAFLIFKQSRIINDKEKIKIRNTYSGIKLLVKPLKLVTAIWKSLREGKPRLRHHDPLTHRKELNSLDFFGNTDNLASHGKVRSTMKLGGQMYQWFKQDRAKSELFSGQE